MFKTSILCSVLILAFSNFIVSGCYISVDYDGNRVCCHGYTLNKDGECVQNCQNCKNGICLGNSVCICIHGKSNDTCLSRCESRCKNGVCEEDECKCNPGYEKARSPALRFSMDYYDDDYESMEDQGECRPVCGNCNNGRCVSPTECQCDEGYEKSSGTVSLCKASCKNCTNGYCVAPNQCRCLPGYKMTNNTCKPNCYGNCPDDKCTGPGLCKCEEGFKWSFYAEKCMAECIYNPCLNRNELCSLKTGKCECEQGYRRNATNACQPICDNICVNGYCSAPNVCSCNKNFTHRNLTYCEPKCDPLCPRNSTCQLDGSCQCDSGFKKIQEICIKDCKCINGFCDLSSSDDSCKCFSGYHLNPKNATECITKCELDGCENGYCGNGGKDCLCNLRYHKDNSTGKCVKCEEGTVCNGEYVPFICDPPCKHGLCIQKNVCACKHGYDRTETSHVCEPVCHGGCLNGVCHSPQNCTCNEGYEKVGDKCQPVCDQQCINGICSAPNVCNCTEGHEFVQNSKHRCGKIKCKQGQKECPPEIQNSTKDHQTQQSAATGSSTETGPSLWAIVLYSFLALTLMVAAAFGIVWYMKSSRNASFPLIENFVYNRMSE